MNNLSNYKTEKIFERLLKNKTSTNYWNYVTELRTRKTEDIYKRSVQLTKSKNLKEKILGITILAQFGHPRLHKKEIVNILFDLLSTETDYKIISSLLYAIGHNNEKLNKKQIELLCSFGNHKSAKVRFSLTSALLGVEKETAIDTQIKLSSDKDSDIRNWATFGIGTQIEIDNQKIRTALWQRINDTDFETKSEAIVGLANRKDEKIKDVIISELKNENDGTLLLEAILTLNDKDFLPLLNRNLKKARKDKEDITKEWISALEETIRELKGTPHNKG